jgi:thiol:disulfide interchange protein
MKLRNYNTGIKMLVMGLLLVFSILSPAFAQKADSTLDQLDFTEIGTDSAAVSTKDKAQLNAANVSAGKTEIDAVKTGPKSGQTEQEKTLLQTFIAGLLGGFIAFLMPCIFPMVPLTVSYFTKRAGSKQKGIGQAMIYGLAIIVIYVAFGLLITLAFGSDKLN